MEVFNNLLQGFVLALSFNNLLACFLGVLIGTIVGVLPGIGPVGAMALLLPFSFGLDAGTSLILLAGIYYGAMYGGSTTSILINVPGEAASVVTCLDGYQMARKGRAGAALAVAGIGSWVAGTVGVAPGPTFITGHSQLFWLVVASMYIGNFMLLILNLPLVGLFASLTKVPAKFLIPVVTAIMFIGAYSLNNSAFDIFMLLFFGLLGFIFKTLNYSATPLLVGLVLGPVFEKSLRQGLIMADGNFLFFVQRPISGTLLAVAALILVWTVVAELRKQKRKQAAPVGE